MRSAHSRVAFAALDNLIDRHYLMSMRQAMEKVYILLEKDLATEYVRIAGVYETYQDAQEDAGYLMDFNEEQKSYKIEEKEMN
jgi:hypothetical protein